MFSLHVDDIFYMCVSTMTDDILRKVESKFGAKMVIIGKNVYQIRQNQKEPSTRTIIGPLPFT
jgi:hypothetical protein